MVGWRRIDIEHDLQRGFLSWFKRRARFLIDENVAAVVIDLLRSRRFNVTSITESGLARLPDLGVYQMARRTRRVLLTFDQDFWDDRAFPLAQSPGIVIMRFHKSDDELVSMIRFIIDVVGPWGELWEAQKLWLMPTGEVLVKVREADTTRVTKTRYRTSPNRGPEVWEPD